MAFVRFVCRKTRPIEHFARQGYFNRFLGMKACVLIATAYISKTFVERFRGINPLKSIAFQDRLVQISVASIRLRSLDIIYYNTANVKSIKLVTVDYLTEIDGVKIFFAVHLLLESFV